MTLKRANSRTGKGKNNMEQKQERIFCLFLVD
jgi:hypothetical protein